ncbi:hypothetical protein [Streptomyces sp. YIM B13518]|uniref:hypothetical protein n=1 Tax=Streptomyces sp. YIM B13518 TaxID=3366316 RepID=UPI0036A64C0E
MTTMHPGYVRAPEMLPVPRPDRIRPEQADGHMCVWCDQEPTVDLGPRLSTHTGALHRWRPRACRPCAVREAGRVLTIHTDRCGRCRQRGDCPDARALHRLATAPRSRPATRRPDR